MQEQHFTVELLDIGSKAQKLQMPEDELAEALAGAGVAIYVGDSRVGVTFDAWRGFLVSCIRSARPGHAGVKSPSDSGETRTWQPDLQELLRTHPDVNLLLHRFVNFLLDKEPGVRVVQNEGTMTITMPGGRRAGLSLRTTGLQLYYHRRLETPKFPLESPDELEPALAWLRSIPPRSRQSRTP